MTITPQGLNDGGTAGTKPAIAHSVAVAETGAIFGSVSAGDNTFVVSVHGDIDMRSAPMLSEFVCTRVVPGMRLVLKLSGVGFFGIAGLAVFAAIEDAIVSTGSTWCIVPGHAVRRLLEAAAVENPVQRFDTVDDALA